MQPYLLHKIKQLLLYSVKDCYRFAMMATLFTAHSADYAVFERNAHQSKQYFFLCIEQIRTSETDSEKTHHMFVTHYAEL